MQYGCVVVVTFFFFNDTATTEIYTLSLHDALPISEEAGRAGARGSEEARGGRARQARGPRLNVPVRPACSVLLDQVHQDRKSTRLNSSHANISYAVFCLKKKKKKKSHHMLKQTQRR